MIVMVYRGKITTVVSLSKYLQTLMESDDCIVSVRIMLMTVLLGQPKVNVTGVNDLQDVNNRSPV